jgi:polyhydroxybutyrate depolymerase
MLRMRHSVSTLKQMSWRGALGRRAVVGLVALGVMTGRGLAVDAAAGSGGNQTAARAGIFPDEKMAVGRQTREYRLVVPDTVDLSKPAALVFAFHGMGEDSKDNMPVSTGLNDLASEHRFIVVYPGAIVREIPQGLVKGWALTPEFAAQDLAFFDALLKKLEGQYMIDANEVFVTGMSNGGYFAEVVGRERSEEVAAVEANSGDLGQLDLALLVTGRKFPVMLVHGADDPIFPVEMAREAKGIYEASDHEVKYVEVPGLGHAWATKVNINEQMWDFFSSHPLNAPVKGAGP